VPGFFRRPVKPSTAAFAFAVAFSVGVTIQFILGVLRDVYVNGNRVNLIALPFYWVLWNLFPLVIFVISGLLQRRGR
jgi:hypothetical protein